MKHYLLLVFEGRDNFWANRPTGGARAFVRTLYWSSAVGADKFAEIDAVGDRVQGGTVPVTLSVI
jgi:hypothetical protein